jgi:hypothetical protein
MSNQRTVFSSPSNQVTKNRHSNAHALTEPASSCLLALNIDTFRDAFPKYDFRPNLQQQQCANLTRSSGRTTFPVLTDNNSVYSHSHVETSQQEGVHEVTKVTIATSRVESDDAINSFKLKLNVSRYDARGHQKITRISHR